VSRQLLDSTGILVISLPRSLWRTPAGAGSGSARVVGVDLLELPAPCPWAPCDEPRALFDDYAGVDGIAGSSQGVEGVLGIDLVGMGRRRRYHADCLLRRVPAFRWVVFDDPRMVTREDGELALVLGYRSWSSALLAAGTTGDGWKSLPLPHRFGPLPGVMFPT
jgi:hypothetical protein